MAVNALVLGVGAAAIVLLTAALAAWPGWRTTRDAARPRGWPPGFQLGRLGLVSSVAVAPAGSLDGCRARPPGRTGGRVGTGAGIGRLAGGRGQRIGAALTFGASLNHMLDTPAMYGWTWDAHIYDVGKTVPGL